MSNPLVVLGATGSIGTQTVDVAEGLGLDVAVLAARSPSAGLVELAKSHPDASIAVAGGASGERADFVSAVSNEVSFGPDAIEAAARLPGHTVVNGIVGAAGLRATVAALETGNRVALANKESLVAGGPVVVETLREHGGELIPVDRP